MSTQYSIPLYKSTSLQQLSRINNSVYGYDNEIQSFIQVDLRHSIVWQHAISQVSMSPLISCRFVDNCFIGQDVKQQSTKQGYVCVFGKSIQKYSFFDSINKSNTNSNNHMKQQYIMPQSPNNNTSSITSKRPSTTLLTSNSMASFTHTLDLYQNSMVFTKLHENHLKYSLNWLQGYQRQKKIIKLIDYNPKSIIINRHVTQQIIYIDDQNHAKYFDLNKPQVQTSLAKKSILLFDSNHLYCTSSNLVSKFNDTYQVQTIDLKTGKYTFTFKGNSMPRKIQSYGNFVFYMTSNALEIYDKRKGQIMWEVGVKQQDKLKSKQGFDSLREFGKYTQRTVNDFLIQPNTGKIYLSLSNQLRVLDFSFF